MCSVDPLESMVHACINRDLFIYLFIHPLIRLFIYVFGPDRRGMRGDPFAIIPRDPQRSTTIN